MKACTIYRGLRTGLSFFFAVLPFLLQAQLLRRPMAAGYTTLGAYSITQADVFSYGANQAALAQLKSNTAGVYAERRFLLTELNNYTMALAVKPTPAILV